MNNTMILQGTLAENVEVKTSKSGTAYANAMIDVESSYDGKSRTDRFPVTLFGDAAKQISDFKAGSCLQVTGSVSHNEHEGKTTFGIVGRKVEQAENGSKNCFTLSGFVNNKELAMKESENGTKYLTLALSVKRDGENEEKQYDTFFVSAFGKTADRMVSNYHKSDLVSITGSLSQSDGHIGIVAHRSELVRAAGDITAQAEDRAKTKSDPENIK